MPRLDNSAGMVPGDHTMYSLTGYNRQGIMEEIFLFHEEKMHPNAFQSIVINAVGKLRKTEEIKDASIHDIAKFLIKKFEFKRFSFTSCIVWDKERKILCDVSIRG